MDIQKHRKGNGMQKEHVAMASQRANFLFWASWPILVAQLESAAFKK